MREMESDNHFSADPITGDGTYWSFFFHQVCTVVYEYFVYGSKLQIQVLQVQNYAHATQRPAVDC